MKRNEAGQGLVEYAIILALVAIVVIAVQALLGPIIQGVFCRINNSLPSGMFSTTDCVAASPDVAVTSTGTSVNIDVADNDWLYYIYYSYSVSAGSDPVHGDLESHVDGTFTYTPTAGFTGVDSFEYILSALGLEDKAQVSIGVGVEVLAADDPDTCTEVNTPAPIDIVYNDFIYPPEGYTVEIVDIPDHGALEAVDALGVYLYTPVTDYEGPDQFSYSICNSEAVCDVALATISVGNCSTPSPLANYSMTMALSDAQDTSPLVPDGTAKDVTLEKLRLLMVDAYAQDAALTAASQPLSDFVTVAATLLQAPEEIEQDFNSGDPALITASLEALLDLLDQAPDEVVNQIVISIHSHIVAGCSALEEAEVTSFEPAMEALIALEELYPGSTGDAIPDLEAIGPEIQIRNVAQNLCSIINVSGNLSPTLTVENDPVSVDEGAIAVSGGMVSDPDGDIVALTANIGSVVNNNDGTWSWSFNTSDGPAESQTVTIEAEDGNGGTAQTSFGLIVNNIAPSVDAITVPDIPIDISEQPMTGVSATFSDPAGINDEQYTCTVDYNDGNGPRAGIVAGSTCSGPLQTYAEAGVYAVTVTISDKDGDSGSATATEFIVIYDPAGGFVTGGGWIDSPAGACPVFCDDATGRANFGFVSKYKKGATMPTGNTQFQFQAADLTFHSETYQWLVVTGGGNTKFRGTGTINGQNAPNDQPYNFIIWAKDGDQDTFRVRIWWEDVDTEIDVYDNGVHQTISGGSIVVHDGKQR